MFNFDKRSYFNKSEYFVHSINVLTYVVSNTMKTEVLL